jgi:hypothetical protein
VLVAGPQWEARVGADWAYRPGQPVPRAGIYQVVRYGDSVPSVYMRFEAGEIFPVRRGWLYWLVLPDPPELRSIEGEAEV